MDRTDEAEGVESEWAQMGVSCPTRPVKPVAGSRIQMAHGSGGRAMSRLLDELIRPAFANAELERQHDGATFTEGDAKLAFTTDSYVINPLFFPGGDIGSLAVHGTVNDIAMCGARPLYLTCALIVEEGFPEEDLERVVRSMADASKACGVPVVTGDTKVVERGKADGLFINTTGVGRVEANHAIDPQAIRPQDAILVSGDLGRHATAVHSAREDFGFHYEVESDMAPLWEIVDALLNAGVEIHCLRDLTRGGLAATLVELAEASGGDFHIRESQVPVSEPVRAFCEVLGLEPLHLANEGRFACILPQKDAERALSIIQGFSAGRQAAWIGEVQTEGSRGEVNLVNAYGSHLPLILPSGELLPRIC